MARSRVAILDSGSLAIDGHKLWWNAGPAGDVRFPVYAVLIEHDDGLLMFDSGFDIDVANEHMSIDAPQQTPEQSIGAQLGLLGFKPSDVTHVMNSHFHYDHVGFNKHLTHATFMVHEAEFEEGKNPQDFSRGYCDLLWAPQLDRNRFDLENVRRRPYWNGPEGKPDRTNPKFELLTGDVEVVPGVWMIETAGHSAGHYSLLVEMKDRPSMLFTMDASYTCRNLDEHVAGGIHLDAVKSLRSIDKLLTLQAAGAEVFVSHDFGPYNNWKKAPNWYE